MGQTVIFLVTSSSQPPRDGHALGGTTVLCRELRALVASLQSFVTTAVADVPPGEDISPATLAFAAAVAFVAGMGRRAKID